MLVSEVGSQLIVDHFNQPILGDSPSDQGQIQQGGPSSQALKHQDQLDLGQVQLEHHFQVDFPRHPHLRNPSEIHFLLAVHAQDQLLAPQDDPFNQLLHRAQVQGLRHHLPHGDHSSQLLLQLHFPLDPTQPPPQT